MRKFLSIVLVALAAACSVPQSGPAPVTPVSVPSTLLVTPTTTRVDSVPYDSTWTIVDSVVTYTHDTTATFYRDTIITVPGDTIRINPVAVLEYTCKTLVCAFDGSKSSDSDGSVVSYQWSVGGNTVSTAPSFTRTFKSTADVVDLTLAVTDNEGNVGSTHKVIDPKVDFPADTVVPTPPDTTPTPPDTSTTPPVTKWHEPTGYSVLFEHDFTRAILPKDKYAMWTGPNEAGCWYSHNATDFANGKMVVVYPVGFAANLTPNKLEAYPKCPPGSNGLVSNWYFRLDGFTPGDGTPAWVNGEGNKVVFLRADPNPALIFKCNSPVRPVQSAVYDRCMWTLYDNTGTIVPATGTGTIWAGKPNDIDCIGSTTAIECWVNGSHMTWKRGLPGLQGVWLDWTYGGGGGPTPVGVRSVWTLDGFRASARQTVTPPPPPTLNYHEPAGLSKITELSFTNSGEGGWSKSSGYGADTTAPLSPSSVLTFTHAANATAVSFNPGRFEYSAFTPVKELYIRGAFELDPSYYANPSNTNKLGIFIGINKGAQIFFNGFGGQNGVTSPLKAEINFQGAVPSLGGNSSSRDGHFGNNVTLNRGQWYIVVLHFIMNTYGQADGVVEGWLIDPLTGQEFQFLNKTNAALIGPNTIPVTSATSGFDVLAMNAIHGGGLVATPAATWIRWDHFYASGK